MTIFGLVASLIDQEWNQMATFNIAHAKSRFSELVRKAMLGEEVIIARDNKPILRLVPVDPPAGKRKPGSGKGQIVHLADDFDATPPEFQDYR
jgi:prevent-host-death family protein